MLPRIHLAEVLLAFAVSACGGNEAAESVESCAEGDLIAQCPPGSNPTLEATAVSMCAGMGDFSSERGKTEGHVEGEW